MNESDFLRQQGEACLSLSQSTFDLTVAGRLRALARDFRAKARELDEEARNYMARRLKQDFPPDGTAG
jgi:hypothetical protein